MKEDMNKNSKLCSKPSSKKAGVQARDGSRHYKTIKAASDEGFREKCRQDYGGEEIVVKGHTLVRDAAVAVSMTAWGRKGFRPIKGVEPHTRIRIHRYRQGYLEFDVYRQDQVEPKRQISPAKTIPVFAALWTINRRAKRCRDLAKQFYDQAEYGLAKAHSSQKERLYDLKGQVLQHLLNENAAVIVGHHRFPNGNWAELIACDGYFFHRPCAAIEGAVICERNDIEAKPKGAKESRIKDARYTLEEFLKDRPYLYVFKWETRVRNRDYSDCDMKDRFEDNREDDTDPYPESE